MAIAAELGSTSKGKAIEIDKLIEAQLTVVNQNVQLQKDLYLEQQKFNDHNFQVEKIDMKKHWMFQ